jgi:hypothetical protein
VENLNDWHDYVRAFSFFISLGCLVTLMVRWKQKRHEWNSKTMDYWYALVMWTLSGLVFTAQGVALDRPMTPGFVFLVMAILVTSVGLHKRGTWGGS